jgi:hypothetical protein
MEMFTPGSNLTTPPFVVQVEIIGIGGMIIADPTAQRL